MSVSLTDKITIRKLVSVANDQLWYEDIDVAAGTMTELEAARDEIDTSDQLDMCENYQRVFVVNGSNLKVADFVNTKLTCSALTKPPAHGDILTQDQGSSKYAYMVVDFVNTAKTAVYGYAYYAGGATAFNTDDVVTSNDATATMDTNFTPTAVTSGPLWYDWTVYPDIELSVAKWGQAAGATKTFGSMPNKAYLIANYRGRLVIAGDPEHPHQWYMARQGNPWDFAYVANDAGSPVKGHDADAGEAGDIIRSLISHKDDYLIIGSVNNMWFIAGDPAEGGSLNELSLASGMLGAKAFAWDKNDNLYIGGTTGLLRITPSFGPPVNLTEESYPDFIKNMDFDPATQRMTICYDKLRHGILISLTTIADGSNSCWWYDLRSSGLFPETYPEEAGFYSMFYYDSNDPDCSGLLLGSRDGYIRVHDDSAKNDDAGESDEAIDSHITIGPLALADGNHEGMINDMSIETSSDPDGNGVDSNDVTYKVFADRSADGCAKKMVENTSPTISGTVSTNRPRGSIIRRKIKNIFAGLRVGNSTASQTWGFNRAMINGSKKGRIR